MRSKADGSASRPYRGGHCRDYEMSSRLRKLRDQPWRLYLESPRIVSANLELSSTSFVARHPVPSKLGGIQIRARSCLALWRTSIVPVLFRPGAHGQRRSSAVETFCLGRCVELSPTSLFVRLGSERSPRHLGVVSWVFHFQVAEPERQAAGLIGFRVLQSAA